MNRKNLLLSLLAIVIFVICFIYVLRPYMCISDARTSLYYSSRTSINSAVEHVNFSSINTSFQKQFKILAIASMPKPENELDHMLLDKLIEIKSTEMGNTVAGIFATPKGLSMLLSGLNIKEILKGSINIEKNKILQYKSSQFESFSKVIFYIQDINGNEIKCVVQKNNTGWKITDIILPVDKEGWKNVL